VAVVYHPYYEPFIRWAQATLGPGGQAAYQRAAGLPHTSQPPHEQLDLRFIPQHGRYSDITSVLNGAGHLQPGSDLLVAFADNLYPHANPSLALASVPAGHTAVLVRPYHPSEAAHRGVIVSRRTSGRLVIADLVEKPPPEQARQMERRHTTSNLWLLEGRARLPRRLVATLHRAPADPAAEPKLSLAIGRYARTEPVHLVITHSAVTDLGTPPAGVAYALPAAISQPRCRR
jgi:UTP-glucose-1-phosphate uridylyltransferase